MSKNKLMIFLIFFIFIASVGFASASQNLTDVGDEDSPVDDDSISLETDVDENIAETVNVSQIDTKIESLPVTTYYKEKSEVSSYLKDSLNQPIKDKKITILLNGKTYTKISDSNGKVTLKLNLKPGNYNALFKFDGDNNYSSTYKNVKITVKKAQLAIKFKSFKTYEESDLFITSKVYNKITKNPVSGVKVLFKVYNHKTKKYMKYYAKTNDKGIATLSKNFKVGAYKIYVQIKDKKSYFSYKNSKNKATLTVFPTAEMGCSSLYVQVSADEAVAGFRRDATNAKNLHIVAYKLNGIKAVKQYKTNSYFFHTITASNGWMAGTGGWDNPTINHAIEKLAGKMFKSGKIKKSYLKKIQGYERQLRIGHFSIKAPDGTYALVWGSGIHYGKLKPGEYICVPNGKSCFRHGSWEKFSSNPAKAAIKIAATDSFGVNRRDATAFHWKATTVEGKTSSEVTVYGANDNGRLMGRSTGHLKDNIYFKGKFFSKNALPKTPNAKMLGTHKFGNIDKLIKTQTTVKAPKISATTNNSKVFNVSVLSKSTKKPISGLKVTLKLNDGKNSKVYDIKTDKKGVAKFNTKVLKVGNYDVLIFSANNKYFISSKSKIVISD